KKSSRLLCVKEAGYCIVDCLSAICLVDHSSDYVRNVPLLIFLQNKNNKKRNMRKIVNSYQN
ncbi:hypothetical protein, partial [uncultured Duncaniella sp.]|uniref:hypothetical protein n=1 Tax=uncultured Duncaniella sp. TaxID=2768039 RepID=UPI0025A97E6C